MLSAYDSDGADYYYDVIEVHKLRRLARATIDAQTDKVYGLRTRLRPPMTVERLCTGNYRV